MGHVLDEGLHIGLHTCLAITRGGHFIVMLARLVEDFRAQLHRQLRHRFIAIYDKTLKEQITNIASVDLRYANGLAVGWREPAAPTAAQPAVAKN